MQVEKSPLAVMAGLDPAIPEKQEVDPRIKPGDDGEGARGQPTENELPQPQREVAFGFLI
jgi:hypothetical protein